MQHPLSVHLLKGSSFEKMLCPRILSAAHCFRLKPDQTNNYVIIRKCQTHSLNSSKLIFSSSETNIIKKKIDDLVTKYEQITGMDEVRKAQNRVIEAQDKFIMAQEKRRDIVKELTSIQNKLKEVYAELDATTRGEERYLTLVTREHNLLKEERKLSAQFNLSEQEERECFTFLSSSVKESHEKERAQAERTKYWSVIGSVVGTVIGVIGSSINNEFKMRELRKLVMDSAVHSQQSAEVDKMAAAVLTRHEEQLNQIIGEMRSVSSSSGAQWGQERGPTLHLVGNSVGVPLDVLLEEQRRETRLVLGLAIVIIPVLVACVNRCIIECTTMPVHRITLSDKEPSYAGCKLQNYLPAFMKDFTGDQLRQELKTWLVRRPYYSIDEFLKGDEELP